MADLDKQIAAVRATGKPMALPGLLGACTGVTAIKARASDEIDNPVDLPGAIAAEIGAAGSNGDLTVDLGDETLGSKVRKGLKNPELVLYKIQCKAYKLSVPLSLPWLWLLFVVGSIAASLGLDLDLFWFLLVFVAPVAHMFAQLEGTYVLSSAGAAWRTGAIAVSGPDAGDFRRADDRHWRTGSSAVTIRGLRLTYGLVESI